MMTDKPYRLRTTDIVPDPWIQDWDEGFCVGWCEHENDAQGFTRDEVKAILPEYYYDVIGEYGLVVVRDGVVIPAEFILAR